MVTVTVKELHEKFDRCCKEGIPFEYECLWDGYEAVRHTDLGYCMLISEEDAAMKEVLYGDDLFYELERDDGEPLSDYYHYYYLEQDGSLYAVKDV